jgi:hypothetical protein
MHGTRSGSAHCPAPSARLSPPVSGVFSASRSTDRGECSTAVVVQISDPSERALSDGFTTALSGFDLEDPATVSCDQRGSQCVGTWTDSSGHREPALAYLDDAFSIRDERGASIAVDRGVRPRYWYFCQGPPCSSRSPTSGGPRAGRASRAAVVIAPVSYWGGRSDTSFCNWRSRSAASRSSCSANAKRMRSAFPDPEVGILAARRHSAAFLRNSRTCAGMKIPYVKTGARAIRTPTSRKDAK